MNHVAPRPRRVIARPPVLYVGAAMVGGVIHLVTPLPIFPPGLVQGLLGIVLLGLGGTLARWSFLSMRAAHTSADPFEPSTSIVTTGPFRLSRNPIYVAMTGMYLGGALLVNSVWLLAMIFPLFLLMHWGVVLREERYLAEQFGQEYASYKSQVRRWL